MHTSLLRTCANTLLAIAIFLIPWHAIVIVRDVVINHEKWHYGTIGIYLGDSILLAAILCTLFVYRAHVTTLITRNVTTILPLTLFLLWCFASALWSPDPMLSLVTASRIALAAALIVACACMPHKRLLLLAFIAGATLQACYGVWQFSTQTSHGSSLLGIAAHDAAWGGSATITAPSGRWLRAYGAMPHPNILGGYAAIALCLTYGVLFTTTHPRMRGFLIGASAILLIALLASGSRSALFALCVGVTIFVALYHRHILTHRATARLASATLIATALLFLFAYHDIFLTRTLHSTTIATNAITDRASYMDDAQKLITAHPLHGVGIGAYTRAAYLIHAPATPIWSVQPVHVVYLIILVELGIVGGGILLWTMWTTRAILHNTAPSPLHGGLYAACGTLIVIGIFDHWPWTAHVGVTTAALCIGTLLVAVRSTQDVPPRQ